MRLSYSSQIALLHKIHSVESYNLLLHGVEEERLPFRPSLTLMNVSMHSTCIYVDVLTPHMK